MENWNVEVFLKENVKQINILILPILPKNTSGKRKDRPKNKAVLEKGAV